MSMYMHRGLFDFVPGKAVNIIFFIRISSEPDQLSRLSNPIRFVLLANSGAK